MTLLSTPGVPSSGVLLDHSTAGTLKVRNFANSADAAITGSSLTLTGTFTLGGVVFSSAVTGTGSLVGSVSPSFTGTLTFAAATGTGLLSAATSVVISSLTAATQALITGTATASFGIFFGQGTPSFTTASTGSLYMNSTGSSTASRLFVFSSAATWIAITTAS